MITYSSNPQSKLNTARWYVELGKTMLRYANKGFGSKSAAMRTLNHAMANLKRVVSGSEPSQRHIPDYTTTISGIPCGIVVQSYTAPKAWRQHTFKGAGPGDCDPPEDEEVSFFVVDRNGYRAKWLERKANWQALTDEVLERVNGLRY